MENILDKKENIIHIFKRKIEKLENYPEFCSEKEHYILEPNKALLYLNDEILSFKGLYYSTLNNLSDIKSKLQKKKKKIKVNNFIN